MNLKKGFTLIELLVVIAIIAILAAILFPVFAQAREKARQTTCLSNTKQIGTALQLYTDDYDETVPFMFDNTITGIFNATYNKTYPCGIWTNWDFYLGGAIKMAMFNYTWEDALFPYVKNIDMFCCPSAQKKVGAYGYNMQLIGGTAGMMKNAPEQNPLCLSEIKNSAEIVFCGETVQWKNNIHKAVHCTPMYYSVDWAGSNGSATYVLCNRHNGGDNFTFCDGHAKYYKRNQGPEKIEGSSNWWGDDSRYWDPDYYKN